MHRNLFPISSRSAHGMTLPTPSPSNSASGLLLSWAEVDLRCGGGGERRDEEYYYHEDFFTVSFQCLLLGHSIWDVVRDHDDDDDALWILNLERRGGGGFFFLLTYLRNRLFHLLLRPPPSSTLPPPSPPKKREEDPLAIVHASTPTNPPHEKKGKKVARSHGSRRLCIHQPVRHKRQNLRFHGVKNFWHKEKKIWKKRARFSQHKHFSPFILKAPLLPIKRQKSLFFVLSFQKGLFPSRPFLLCSSSSFSIRGKCPQVFFLLLLLLLLLLLFLYIPSPPFPSLAICHSRSSLLQQNGGHQPADKNGRRNPGRLKK